MRELAHIKEIARKQQVAQRYNAWVKERKFAAGDLILRRASIGNKNTRDGKLAANWEGPYRISQTTESGAYALETLTGKALPRTFNVLDLKRFYS